MVCAFFFWFIGIGSVRGHNSIKEQDSEETKGIDENQKVKLNSEVEGAAGLEVCVQQCSVAAVQRCHARWILNRVCILGGSHGKEK